MSAHMDGIARIAAERRRQVEREGWTAEHDDTHERGEMATCAAVYALPDYQRQYVGDGEGGAYPTLWPFDCYDWKPGDRIRELEKAGALIAAEIDRLLRAEREEERP